MKATSSVFLIVPDDEGAAAIGPNPYDPERRGPAAEAGQAQGARLAAEVDAMW
jgi:NTE family protein